MILDTQKGVVMWSLVYMTLFFHPNLSNVNPSGRLHCLRRHFHLSHHHRRLPPPGAAGWVRFVPLIRRSVFGSLAPGRLAIPGTWLTATPLGRSCPWFLVWQIRLLQFTAVYGLPTRCPPGHPQGPRMAKSLVPIAQIGTPNSRFRPEWKNSEPSECNSPPLPIQTISHFRKWFRSIDLGLWTFFT